MPLTHYIYSDIQEVITYLPAGISAGFLLTLLSYLIHRIYANSPKNTQNSSHTHLTRYFLIFLFFTYLYITLHQSFFSRPLGSRQTVDFTFLGTWGSSAQSHAYVVENIIMFLPFGILLPLIMPFFRKHPCLCVFLGAACSVSLETAQFITKRGHCQLDDVVMNTLGMFMGWLLIKIGSTIKSIISG